MWAVTATISNGKTMRIPNTAMGMPQVMNRCRQTASMCCRTAAFTTALSNDNDTSSTASTATMNVTVIVPDAVPVVRQPSAAATGGPRR